MATSTSDMPLSGGHLALDFVNTVDSRRGRWGPDLLTRYEDIVVLARRHRVLDQEQADRLQEIASAEPRSAAAALEDAIKLREATYALYMSEDAQQPPPDIAFDAVHAAARKGRAKQVLVQSAGDYRWQQPVEQLSDLIDLLACVATDLLISRGSRRPVRECKGDNCGWLFLDTSKSGRRLWCSEATCGSHARVKRFRKNRG